MKKLTALLLICVSTLALAQSKINYKKRGAAIPPFTLEAANGQILTNAVLRPGRPVLLMIFSPDCEHCSHKLDTLSALGGGFKSTQVLLVTELRNKANFAPFMKKKGLNKLPQFKNAGLDRGDLIANVYTYQLLPQYNFYNAQGKLVKTFSGNAPVDSLQMFIK